MTERLSVALRNEHAPSFAPAGWMTLEVKVSPTKAEHMPLSGSLRTPRGFTPASRTRTPGARSARKAASDQPTPAELAATGPARFNKSSYNPEDAAQRRLNTKMMGSFATGVNMIWREVPATEDRPKYYYSEHHGVSQWNRPRTTKPREMMAARDEANELKQFSPRYSGIRVTDQVPEPADMPPYSPPPPPPKPPREDGEPEEEEEEGEEAFDPNGPAEPRPYPPRLPMLSEAARNTGDGKPPAKFRSAPSEQEIAALREVKDSKLAFEVARQNRYETDRRTKLQYEATIAAVAARKFALEMGYEAAQPAGGQSAKSRRSSKEIADAPAAAAPPPPTSSLFGKKEELSAAALKIQALFDEPAPKPVKPPPPPEPPKKKKEVAKPVGAGKITKEKRLTPMETQVILEEKLDKLRNDDEKLHLLRKSIEDEKEAAVAAVKAVPGYKDFGKVNAQLVPNFRPERRRQILEERSSARKQLQDEAHHRHAELLRREVVETMSDARSRTGDYWTTGHWSVELPKSMQSSPRTPRRAVTSQQEEDALMEKERESTLNREPGVMYPESTAKGRARKLAAQIARMNGLTTRPQLS